MPPAGPRARGRSFSFLPPSLLFVAGSSAPPTGPRAIGRYTSSAAAPPFRCRFIRAAGRLFPLLLPSLLFAAGSSAPPDRPRARGRNFPSSAAASPFRRRPSFSPPVHPCRRPAPCPRPEFSSSAAVPPFRCRPSFSPPVHPRRRPAPCPRPVYLLLRAAGWPSFCQNARSRNANLPCRAAILPFC